MIPTKNLLLLSLALTLLQGLAALPWLAALDPTGFRRSLRRPAGWLGFLGIVVGVGLAASVVLNYLRDSDRLELYGRIYASVLHWQLLVDLFLIFFAALLLVWPRGGAVALASFREGIRQPMFWLLTGGAATLLVVSMVIPYFTFGDDFKMMKLLGFDITMLSAGLFGVLAAGISIHEEIEGRTAVTLMSKPITRRQFLLGKYLGILMACWAMTVILGWCLNWVLHIKPHFDRLDDAVDPMPEQVRDLLIPQLQALVGGTDASGLIKGISAWTGQSAANLLGLFVGFGQVMVLLGIATALATRMSLVVNVVICLVLFFLGHLSPVLVRVSEQLRSAGGPGTSDLVSFLARLIDTLSPALEFFNNGPATIRDNPLDVGQFAVYVGGVTLYAIVYTLITLCFGLILFEDRDLA